MGTAKNISLAKRLNSRDNHWTCPCLRLPCFRIPVLPYSRIRAAISMALAEGNTDIIRNKPKGMQSRGPE